MSRTSKKAFLLFFFIGCCFSFLWSQELGRLDLTYHNLSSRSIFQGAPSDYFYQSFYLNFWQSFDRWGSLRFAASYLLYHNQKELSFFSLNIQDVPLGKFKIQAGFGYTSFQISRLVPYGSFNPSRFVALKGGNLTLASKKATFIVLGGELYSFLGPEEKKSRIYGFEGIFNLSKGWTLGAGYFKGHDLATDFGSRRTGESDIFAIDSSLRMFSNFYLLGDAKYVLFSGDRKKNDYAVKIGPYWRSTRFTVQFYYHYASPDFPQIERTSLRDRRSYTAVGEFRPLSWLSLFGSADTSNENLEKILERPITDYLTYSYGASLSPRALPNVAFGLSTGERKSERAHISSADTVYNLNYLSVFKQLGRYYLSLRLTQGQFKDYLAPSQGFKLANYSLDFRKMFLSGSFVYFNGFFTEQKSSADLFQRRNWSLQTGATWRPVSSFMIHGQLNITLEKETTKKRENRGIGGEIGAQYQFVPFNLNLSLSYRYSQFQYSLSEARRRQDHQVVLNVTKSLSWGRPATLGPVKNFADLFRGGAKIEGYVFVDTNQNQAQDPDEEALAEVGIMLDGRVVARTDDRGFYKMTSVSQGLHRVSIDLRKVPATYGLTSEDVKDIVTQGKERHSLNFTVAPLGSLRGRVILDANNDGEAGREEPAMEGIRLSLLREGSMLLTALSNSSGFFKFDNLLSGKYTIEVDSESLGESYGRFEKSSLEVALKPGEDVHGLSLLIRLYEKPKAKRVFTLYEGSISGRIIDDANRNGRLDAEEPGVPHVLVRLKQVSGKDQIEPLSIYTDQDGNFVFESILPGEYDLFLTPEILPQGSVLTVPASKRIKLTLGQRIENQYFFISFPQKPKFSR
jgi:hypothetical protein